MDLLPSPQERKWLARYLRKLVQQSGIDPLVSSPILEPTPEAFPDPWSGRLEDVHRLTQRLMHAAGLGDLEFTITGIDAGLRSEEMWDAGTAGWFAGIVDGRVRFGVHPSQLRDGEQAVATMAHEVAHAFRQHKHLVADDRQREELLTDLTTIYLGFGILTTNATDRYRSSGNWSETRWSTSSLGYLPPQSMAWLLALQVASRGGKEYSRVARFLEPNQAACLEAAMEEIARNPGELEALRFPPRESWPSPRELAPIEIRDPLPADIDELPAVDERQRNRGVAAYRVEDTPPGFRRYLGGTFGAAIGLFAAAVILDQHSVSLDWLLFAVMVLGGFAIGSFLAVRMLLHRKCSACDIGVKGEAICPHCGATLGVAITIRELTRIREEELDRRAADLDFPDCSLCQPEVPCEEHRATERFEDWVAREP